MAHQTDLMRWTTANVSSDLTKQVEQMEMANGGDAKEAKSGNKRLSVERIYQKKSQLEHILLRPDTYIGTVERLDQDMWVYEGFKEQMELKKVSFVPGLYKIFDEILVNAADNKQRDHKMNTIKIDIDRENDTIRIFNNGKGIPVVQHKTEKMFVPTLIFGHLLTSSNYDDTERKVTGGRNGYGAKLCNIFSSKFTVETSCKEYRKKFRQSWADNMSKAGEPKISASEGEDYTSITFKPDLKRFKMDKLDDDICDIFTRRAYDMAAAVKGVKVYLNGKKLDVKNFSEYIKLYLNDNDAIEDIDKDTITLLDENTDRWQVTIAPSNKGFQQMSFVNSIATTKGGRHVDYVADQIVDRIIGILEKTNKSAKAAKDAKGKKGAKAKVSTIKPFQVKNHLFIFINCLIENPTFDSQTKENMTLVAKNFGSKFQPSEKMMKRIGEKCQIVQNINNWIEAKDKVDMKRQGGGKKGKIKGLTKLEDANLAGTKRSDECTLILTEGDSAKTLAVAGINAISRGRDVYGVFPLKGKLLNVRDASKNIVAKNMEITNVMKILGLLHKEKYETQQEIKDKLRYGKLMIMADQDQDGSHIKGLIINFIHTFWPNLLKLNFVEQFITPIVKAKKKGHDEIPFYTLPEVEEWKQNTPKWHTYELKYYKGLGTSTGDEGKDYFRNIRRHRIPFKYESVEDDRCINLAFSKKKIEERKDWLTNWMESKHRREDYGLDMNTSALYTESCKSINFADFINRELILFSNMDNERSIPSLMDGFKPTQRKILFACLKRKLFKKEVKVSQLAGSVSEISGYHHGEVSLQMAIIGMAMEWPGSNNLALLEPRGSFGSRLKLGKDHASPRYLTTLLNPVARCVFPADDDPLLKYNWEENLRVEPDWYAPIIPMILVNGADGIGTGWSTKVFNYDVAEVVANIRRMLDGEEPREMHPYYDGFRGTIEKVDDQRYIMNGEIALLEKDNLEITEIPLRTSITHYKAMLEYMMTGVKPEGEDGAGIKKAAPAKGKDKEKEKEEKANKKDANLISSYNNYSDTNTVKFRVTMTAEKLAKARAEGLHKVYKLQESMPITNMVLFDSRGVLRKYDSVMEIMREFFTVRLEYYQRRKDYLVGLNAAECLKADNIMRFISEKIDNVIVVENKRKKDIYKVLTERGYDSDPVAAWKVSQKKLSFDEEEKKDDDEEMQETKEKEVEETGPDYMYLLNIKIYALTKERRAQLEKDRAERSDALYKLRHTSIQDLWRNDLNSLMNTIEVEKQNKEKRKIAQRDKDRKDKEKEMKKEGKRVQKLPSFVDDTKPTVGALRIEPVIDQAMRARGAKAKRAKDKKEGMFAIKKEEGGDDDDDDDDDNEFGLNKSLSDRLGGTIKSEPDAKPVKEKKPRKPREPKDPSSPKGKKGKKEKDSLDDSGKKRKRNPWSDVSDVSEDDLEIDDFSDHSDDFVQPREKTAKRGAAKAKYTFDDDDSDDDDDEFPGDDNHHDDSVLVGGGDAKDSDSDDNAWQKELSDDDDGFGLSQGSQDKGVRQANGVVDEPSDSGDAWAKAVGHTPEKQSSAKTNNGARPASPVFGADSDDDGFLNDKPYEAPAPAKKPAAKKPAAPKAKKGKVDAKQPSILTAMNKVKDKPAAAKKKKPVNFIASESDGSGLEFFEVEKVQKPKEKKKKKAPVVKDDFEDKENEQFFASSEQFFASSSQSQSTDGGHDSKATTKKTKRATQPKKAAPKRKITDDSDDEEKPKKAPAKKRAPAKKKAVDAWDSDDSEGGFGAKKPAKKRAKKADSDSEEDFTPKKPKTSKSKKAVDSDLDLDDEPVAPRAGGGRARKQVQYNFGESESEDDF